jgi:hypothetical protein
MDLPASKSLRPTPHKQQVHLYLIYHSPPLKNCAKVNEEEYIKGRIFIGISGGGWSM